MVERRTPTPLGEARTFLGIDFGGSNAFVPGGNGVTAVSDDLLPRLFVGYVSLGSFLAGQANPNFSDPDSSPETIDFGGDFGAG